VFSCILLVRGIVNSVSGWRIATKCEPRQQIYLQLHLTFIYTKSTQSQIMWVYYLLQETVISVNSKRPLHISQCRTHFTFTDISLNLTAKAKTEEETNQHSQWHLAAESINFSEHLPTVVLEVTLLWWRWSSRWCGWGGRPTGTPKLILQNISKYGMMEWETEIGTPF